MDILKKLEAVKKSLGLLETKADEAMHTTNTGSGEEFVETGFSTNILALVREQTNFSAKFPAPITMPTADYKLPVEGADPVFSYTAENGDVPATEYANSKAGTSEIFLSAKKFTAVAYLSGELDEDGIINMRGYVEQKIAKQYGEVLDKVLINGDTATGATGNVNSDDGAPTAGSYFLATDGLRKRAIVTDTNTVDCGALDLADIRTARAKLPDGKGLNPNELILGVGTDVYFKLLAFTQAETVEKFGGQATVVNGTLASIDGVEIAPTGFIGRTEADGKQSSTPANNTTGQALLVYKDDVIRGFKRDLKTYVEYLPRVDQFAISAHFRYAQTIRANSTVALINITL